MPINTPLGRTSKDALICHRSVGTGEPHKCVGSLCSMWTRPSRDQALEGTPRPSNSYFAAEPYDVIGAALGTWREDESEKAARRTQGTHGYCVEAPGNRLVPDPQLRPDMTSARLAEARQAQLLDARQRLFFGLRRDPNYQPNAYDIPFIDMELLEMEREKRSARTT